MSYNSLSIIESTKNIIKNIRVQFVIIDSDLANIYGVETKRLNEQVRRNIHKFPVDFMFLLNYEEFDTLRSQNATSKGGRRYLPYAFTEHGVLQAANVLNSPLANSMSIFVIRAFIELRQVFFSQQEIITKTSHHNTVAITDEKINRFFQDIKPKLLSAVNHILEAVVDNEKGKTIKEEARDLLKESIQNLKDRLKKTGLENEEIAARITKILSEAEKERAIARKTNAESEQIEFITTVRKLRLVLEAHQLLQGNLPAETKQIDSFLSILKDLAK